MILLYRFHSVSHITSKPAPVHDPVRLRAGCHRTAVSVVKIASHSIPANIVQKLSSGLIAAFLTLDCRSCHHTLNLGLGVSTRNPSSVSKQLKCPFDLPPSCVAMLMTNCASSGEPNDMDFSIEVRYSSGLSRPVINIVVAFAQARTEATKLPDKFSLHNDEL